MVSSKSKPRDSAKKDKSDKTKKSTKKTPPPGAYKSEEFVQDSDDEVEKGEAASGNSNDSSDSDESSSSAKPVKASSKTNGKLPAPAGSSSSSSEGETEESEESSEEEEDSEDAVMEEAVVIEPTKKPSKQPPTILSKARAPYQPPPGFELASLDGTSKASQMLKKSSLEGKQMWYFTAPASVPISSIEAMSLLDAKKGQMILTHEGNDYGFMKHSAEDTTYTRIMVPSSDAGYKATSKVIDHVFHLQQIAKDPTTENPARATIPAKKPVRQQPRGLKMRFHPIGFGAEQPGIIGSSSSDEDMNDAPSSRPTLKSKGFVRPDADSDDEMEDGPPLPHRPHPENNASSPDGTSKKDKKKRKHSEGGEKKSKHSSSNITGTSNHRELKRSKKKQTESQKKPAGNRSASIDSQKSTEPLVPLRPKTPPTHPMSTTPIPPPKPLIFSQPSTLNGSMNHSKLSSKKSKSFEKHRSSAPSSNSQLSLPESTQATGPNLTEERPEKKRKLKHKDAKKQKDGSA